MSHVRGVSFWRQNQIWRTRTRSLQNDLNTNNVAAAVMSSAQTRLSAGLSMIANQQAIDRVHAQIKAAVAAGIQSGDIQSAASSTTGKSINKIA
jgi:hypothetical protein